MTEPVFGLEVWAEAEVVKASDINSDNNNGGEAATTQEVNE